MESTEYAVIGAGLAGASTAWHLAARGHEVAVLERSTPANDAGSSHGSARIFRYAYPDQFYTRLVQRSEDGWAELARLGGRQLITTPGPSTTVPSASRRHSLRSSRRAGSSTS